MACDGRSLTPGPFKSALFQLFDVHGKTVPVPLQKPDLVETLSKENKHVTAQRIGAEFIPDKACKRMDTEPHVRGGAVEKIPAGIR